MTSMGNRGFSLSRPRGKALPKAVESSGRTFPIRPDFWNILRILRMLNDSEIPEWHKPSLLARWFYGREEDLPENGMDLFLDFLLMGEEQAPGTEDPESRICYEFDAPEIYSAFFHAYGMDLLQCQDLHWWQFLALLRGLLRTENALSKKLELRTLDTSRCENPARAEAAKRAVQIPTAISREEQHLQRELEQALLAGGDISNVLKRYQHGD